MITHNQHVVHIDMPCSIHVVHRSSRGVEAMDDRQQRRFRALDSNAKAIIQKNGRKLSKGSISARAKAAKELEHVAIECDGGGDAIVAAGALPALCDLLASQPYSPDMYGHTLVAARTLNGIATSPSCSRVLVQAGLLSQVIRLLAPAPYLLLHLPS